MFINEYGDNNNPLVLLLAPMMVSGEDLYQLMHPFFKHEYHYIAPDQGGHEKGVKMKIYEFGKEHTRSFAMFQCAVEPWWVFKASAEEMAKDYHVYLFIADGHDELGTEFISLEKYVKDAAEYLRKQNVGQVDGMYGVSMGGAAVIRFLATEDISVEKAIIDAGITPYPYPKWICRLISVKDWITVILGTRSLKIMKAVYPPERWTPKGEDPETHYRALLKFYKQHYSPRTIYNVFWSTDNYSIQTLFEQKHFAGAESAAIFVSSGMKRMSGTAGSAAGVFKEDGRWGCLKAL